MGKTKFRITDPTEAAFLAEVEVRRVLPTELARCEKEVCESHYLKTADLVGEQLWYVAEDQGQWLGLLGWSAAAYHLKGRDSWIGWNDTQRRGIQVREVTPQQMGFPHAHQLARVDRIRELKGGKQEVETVWIITSLAGGIGPFPPSVTG